MLDQLLEIVQQQSQTAVVENNDVPNEHNDAVMQEAGNSIMGSLQSMLAQGRKDEVATILKGDNLENNEAMGFISGNFIENITSKLGIDKSVATGIAASILPQILSSFLNKAKDPNDSSFDMGSIINSLGNRNTSSNDSGIGGMISSIGSQVGLDKDRDGDVDLGDLLNMFK